MNPLDKDILATLRFDGLHEAELLTGKSYKEDKVTESLGFLAMMANNEKKREVLSFMGDAHFGTTLPEYIGIIEKIGFQKVYEKTFSQMHCGSLNENCKQFVFFEPKRGILLHFDTYSDGVNGGNWYFNWKPTKVKHHWELPYLPISGGMDKTGTVLCGNFDCREAIKQYMSVLEENGEFITPWIERPFLRLLTWADTKGENGGDGKYDYNAINEFVIAQLPESVQRAITP